MFRKEPSQKSRPIISLKCTLNSTCTRTRIARTKHIYEAVIGLFTTPSTRSKLAMNVHNWPALVMRSDSRDWKQGSTHRRWDPDWLY